MSRATTRSNVERIESLYAAFADGDMKRMIEG